MGGSGRAGSSGSFVESEVDGLEIEPAWVESRLQLLRDGREPQSPTRHELVSIIPFLDLTTLRGDDTTESVQELCRVARSPLSSRTPKASDAEVTGAGRPSAVCIHQAFIPTARHLLEGSGIRVATVAGGFPHGLTTLRSRLLEVREAVALGAHEIDVVFPRHLALEERWGELHSDLSALRAAAGDRTLKVILATGELGTPSRIARASRAALEAGADFIKTSTGMESVNATLVAGLVMAREVRSFHRRTGVQAGLKAAGGIGDPEVALDWLRLMRQELGEPWLRPRHFRFGASSLLGAVVRRLDSLAGNTDQRRT